MVDKSGVDWHEMNTKLGAFRRGLFPMEEYSSYDLDLAWTELTYIVQPLLALGLKGIDLFGFRSKVLGCRLGIKGGVICGFEVLCLPFRLVTLTTWRHPSLRRVIMRPYTRDQIGTLCKLMNNCPELQQVDISSQDHQVFVKIQDICHICFVNARRLEVTLFDHDFDREGRRLVKLEIVPGPGNGDSPSINIMEWMYTHVTAPQCDWDAHVLDHVTRYSPTALVSLTLNLSNLTADGLATMQRVLQQAELEQLHIECAAFEQSLVHELCQVLGAMQCPTVKSLELSGEHIDDWIQLWATQTGELSFSPHLLTLMIRNTGSTQQLLTHASVLFLHKLLYFCPLANLYIKDIGLQDESDWDMILGAVNVSELATTSLANCNNT
ncbi:hypothetical protein BG003_002781 [Podila horticola]|nr:hypothetical protein BG003_002781 [Podila horticola]